jgi:hypothetical protein
MMAAVARDGCANASAAIKSKYLVNLCVMAILSLVDAISVSVPRNQIWIE